VGQEGEAQGVAAYPVQPGLAEVLAQVLKEADERFGVVRAGPDLEHQPGGLPSGRYASAPDMDSRFQLNRCRSTGSGRAAPRWPAPAAAARTRTRPGTLSRRRGAGRFLSAGLKHRAAGEIRSIPIPPALVALLRAHLKTYGAAPDGRLFRTSRGGTLQDSAYSTVWQTARAAALTPAQHASPLARRPYDLRHAAVSLWLNSGVPATEVARRAGHSVAVLLKVYAHCIDGQADTVNKRIADALGGPDPSGG